MSKKQNTLDLKQSKMEGTDWEDVFTDRQRVPFRAHFPLWSSVYVCACASARLHVYLICFQEILVKGFEMQVSTRRKVCLWPAQTNVPSRRFQTPWMTLFSFTHSGRSLWEEPEERPQSYKPEAPPPSLPHKNETRCDKLLNPCHSTLLPFLSLPRFRSRSAEEGQKKEEKERGKKKRRKKTPSS